MKRVIRYRGKRLTEAPHTITDATTKRRIGHADECDYRVYDNHAQSVAVYCETLSEARQWLNDLELCASFIAQFQIQKRSGHDWVSYRQLHNET